MSRLKSARLLLFLLVFSLPGVGFAATIIADGLAYTSARKSPAKVRDEALATGLAEAASRLATRHLDSVAGEDRRTALEKFAKKRASSLIRKYSIIDETEIFGTLRLRVRADVDREKLLADMRLGGFPVKTLERNPRFLIVALGGEPGSPAVRSLRTHFLEEGFEARVYLDDNAETADFSTLARWGRELGCHIVIGVESERAQLTNLNEDPLEEGGYLSSAKAWAWMVASRTGELIDDDVFTGWGDGGDPVAAVASSYADAGTGLFYPLMETLVGRGWRLEGVRELYELRVTGLVSPANVEAIEEGLGKATEIYSAELHEIGRDTAIWRVRVARAGMGWDAILAAIRFPTGRLSWEGESGANPGGLPRVVSRWEPR